MNKTIVKRGIGAVILALIAAALLAFLLKDKAAQRQEVVEIPLPGTGDSGEVSDQSTRLPTLTMDNSGDGSVVANAGSGNGDTTDSTATNTGTGDGSASANTAQATSNTDGTIVASAAAVGAATSAKAATDTTKNVDFSVKPKTSEASSEFLNLDLVNNGTPAASDSATAASEPAPTTAATTQQAAPKSSTSTDEGVVIASTSPKSKSSSTANAVQPRLIGEKKAPPVKSSKTATVVTKKAATSPKTIPAPKTPAKASSSAPASTGNAKNGYAIQLLATSSAERANNLKKVMAGEGYPTYVTKTKQNGKTLYRVRIGQYKLKAEAVKIQTAMKRRYKKNTNVNRSAVVAR